MIHVRIIAELPEDETGPHVIYEERFTLPPWFARTAAEAHNRIISALATERREGVNTGERLDGAAGDGDRTVRGASGTMWGCYVS